MVLTYRGHRISLIGRGLQWRRWHVLCCQRPSLRLSATSSRAEGAAKVPNTRDSPSITLAASPSFMKAPLSRRRRFPSWPYRRHRSRQPRPPRQAGRRPRAVPSLAQRVTHEPSRLVGHADRPEDLMGAHALLRAGHQLRDVEPLAEGNAGVLEDRSHRDGELLPAVWRFQTRPHRALGAGLGCQLERRPTTPQWGQTGHRPADRLKELAGHVTEQDPREGVILRGFLVSMVSLLAL